MKDKLATATSEKTNTYSEQKYISRVTIDTTVHDRIKTSYQTGQVLSQVKDSKTVKRERIQALNKILEKAGL